MARSAAATLTHRQALPCHFGPGKTLSRARHTGSLEALATNIVGNCSFFTERTSHGAFQGHKGMIQPQPADSSITNKRGNSNLTIMRGQSSSSVSSSSQDGNVRSSRLRQKDETRSTSQTRSRQTTETDNAPQPTWKAPWNQWEAFRQKVGMLVNNQKVQFFIVFLIALNAMMMDIGTSKTIKENESARDAFEMVDKVFLIIFTIELGMQFIYHGWRILIDGWLLFDTIIIVISWSFSEVQIVRAFRIFRALRLITRIKVMKNLILALFSVIPRILAIVFLLSLVSYIFAVMFTQLFKDLYDDGLTSTDFFGRIDKTFFTLFQIMTLDNWADIAREVMSEYAWAWLPFIIFVIITGFVVVNLMIAVICDSIAALHDDDRAKLHGMYDEDHPAETQQGSPAFVQGNVQEQLDALEDQVDELSRMQEETLLALETLAQQLQMQRNQKDLHSEAASRDRATSQDS